MSIVTKSELIEAGIPVSIACPVNIVCNPGVTEIQLPDLTIHLSEGEFITTEDIVNIESEKGA